MHRTNLAIKREIIKYFIAKNISYSNRYGCFMVKNSPIRVIDGYVYATIFAPNGSIFVYQVEYLSASSWYKKFAEFKKRSSAVVLDKSPKFTTYVTQKKKAPLLRSAH